LIRAGKFLPSFNGTDAPENLQPGPLQSLGLPWGISRNALIYIVVLSERLVWRAIEGAQAAFADQVENTQPGRRNRASGPLTPVIRVELARPRMWSPRSAGAASASPWTGPPPGADRWICKAGPATGSWVSRPEAGVRS